MSTPGLLDHPFGHFCFNCIKLFSIISLFAIPYQQVLFCHFSKVKVLKLITEITTGYYSLPYNLCKIYEMVLLNRLEKFAEHQGLCSNMQFGFKEGLGCTEASFGIHKLYA